MTQTRLKSFSNLHASTTSYLVNDLRKFGMVVDSGETEQFRGPGKPGNLLQLNNDFAQFVGCYVENMRINLCVIGLDGQTILHVTKTIEDQKLIEETLIKSIRNVIKGNPKIRGIGVAMKALVLIDGTIRIKYGEQKHEAMKFEGFLQHLSEAFPKMPVVVENDANCTAILYQHEQKEREIDLLLYLLNKNPFGVGCSILVKGKILKGNTGAAGQYFEKGIKLQRMSTSILEDQQYLEKFIAAVMPHVSSSAYLIDPKKIVLSGSVFNEISPERLENLNHILKEYDIPMDMVITKGNHELDPAKGAALIAMNDYISTFIEKAGAR